MFKQFKHYTIYNTNQKASKLISTSIQTKKLQNQTKKPQHAQKIQTLYNIQYTISYIIQYKPKKPQNQISNQYQLPQIINT